MYTIIVPYRDRNAQLEAFIEHMQDHNLLIVEQTASKPFNRGKLLNIGFLNSDTEWVIFHDVDMLPISVDYTPRYGITQLASSKIQLQDYLGGVTMFDRATFQQLGGYHNDYWHRAEDNELMFQAKRKKVPIYNRFGTYRNLNHPRPMLEFDPALWQKAQLPRDVDNQLDCCEYTIIEQRPAHIVVDL